MLINLLLIPMMINKYKAQRVRLKRKRARARHFDDDEFADDLDEFFD